MNEHGSRSNWILKWSGRVGAAALWIVAAGAFAEDTPDAPDRAPDESIVAETGGAVSDDAYENMELLTQVMLHIRKQYHEEKTFEEITHAALHGLLKSLDPHSDFLEPKAFQAMRDDTRGKFGGIGIHIGVRDGLLTVIAPIEDTPAFQAGLQAGDHISAIDGESTIGMSLRAAVERLRGPPGEPVTVTIARRGEDEVLDIEIVRAEIKVPSVKGRRMLDDGIGYLRVTQFSAPTAALLGKEIEQLVEDGMTALILDLRNNPGGLLRSAIRAADVFLDKGAVIVSTRSRDPVADQLSYKAAGPALTDVPMAVLINSGSASASEIVAGALQDHKRAVLLGDTSFGKGSVQSVIRLKPDGAAAIRLTTALYFTPNGRQIHEKGVDPDIPVYVTADDWRDAQIRRAHIENPDMYPDDVKEQYRDVTDEVLLRAADLLRAVKIFGRPAAR
jgi:carboxyl-terminal processing protease